MINTIKKRYLKLIEAATFEDAIEEANAFANGNGITILNYQDLGTIKKEVTGSMMPIEYHRLLLFYEVSKI